MPRKREEPDRKRPKKGAEGKEEGDDRGNWIVVRQRLRLRLTSTAAVLLL